MQSSYAFKKKSVSGNYNCSKAQITSNFKILFLYVCIFSLSIQKLHKTAIVLKNLQSLNLNKILGLWDFCFISKYFALRPIKTLIVSRQDI